MQWTEGCCLTLLCYKTDVIFKRLGINFLLWLSCMKSLRTKIQFHKEDIFFFMNHFFKRPYNVLCSKLAWSWTKQNTKMQCENREPWRIIYIYSMYLLNSVLPCPERKQHFCFVGKNIYIHEQNNIQDGLQTAYVKTAYVRLP